MKRYSLIIGMIVLAGSVRSVAQEGSEKTHCIIICYVRINDSLRLVEAEDARIIRQSLSLLNTDSDHRYYTLAAVKADLEVDEVVGISGLFTNASDLHSNVGDMLSMKGSFNPDNAGSKVMLLPGGSLLGAINKRLNDSDLYFHSSKVLFLNFTSSYSFHPDDRSIIDDRYFNRLLLQANHDFRLESPRKARVDAARDVYAFEFDLVATQTGIFKKDRITFENDRLVNNGEITLKNTDTAATAGLLRYKAEIIPLKASLKFLEADEDLWVKTEDVRTAQWCFHKQVPGCEQQELTPLKPQKEGMPIYPLLEPYFGLDEGYSRSNFPELETRFYLTARLMNGEYDRLVIHDSMDAAFNVLSAKTLTKDDIVLNNPALLKYAEGKELTHAQVYDKLVQKDKKLTRLLIILLLLLMVITWWWYRGRKTKYGRMVLAKLGIRNPQAPRMPRAPRVPPAPRVPQPPTVKI